MSDIIRECLLTLLEIIDPKMINNETTLVSKHQLLDYVSKRDFNDFTADTRDFHEVTGVRFDTIDKRFDAVDARFDAIEARLASHDKRFDSIDKQLLTLNRKFDELKEDTRVQIGAALNQFKEFLDVGMEYVENVDEKKVDKDDYDRLKAIVQRYLKNKDKIIIK